MAKKNIRVIVAAILCCAMMFAFSACSTKLSGTYTAEGIIEQSFTFKEDNVVEFSAFGVSAEGTYKIEDDKITITYKLFNLSYDMEKSFEKDGNSIIIGGTEFVKK